MKLNLGRDLFVCVRCVSALPVCKDGFECCLLENKQFKVPLDIADDVSAVLSMFVSMGLLFQYITGRGY